MNSQSAASSQASEGLSLDSSEKDSAQSGSSRKTNTRRQSSERTSQAPIFIEILRRLILAQFRVQTSSQEDFPARTSAMLERELASRGVVLHSGNITLKPLGFYDRSSQSLRMFQRSLAEDSMLSLQTLPRSGMMQNGIIFQLPQLERFTAEKESSSLPIPQAMDSREQCRLEEELSPAAKKGGCKNLREIVYRQEKGVLNIPTPTSSDAIEGWMENRKITKDQPTRGVSLKSYVKMFPTPMLQDARIGAGNVGGNKHRLERGSVALADVILFPTPTTQDFKRRGPNSSQQGLPEMVQKFPTATSRDWKGSSIKKDSLWDKVKELDMSMEDSENLEEDKPTGKLNPIFVEWLMGFPEGWTLIDGENASKLWEMQSSRKSHRSSQEQSKVS